MTYGKEDTDYKIDGVPSSGYIFNAAENVFWQRTRDLKKDKLDALYQTIDPNCWSANHLINEFDAWQEQFPEELWRVDIERKYYRTWRGEGLNGGKAPTPTPRFLATMMNGRKKYQRRQFERDQEAYMGTKHLTSGVKADQIMFRCNTPTGSDIAVAPDYTLRIVPYSDMYLSVLFGNSSPTQIRAKAGQEYVITCPYSTMDDTAILIYCASRIQRLNDLSACYIHDNDFSNAIRLQTLVIGNTTEGYANTFLTTLNLGSNALLETLDIRNCPNLTGLVNLSSCRNLVNFYATGTVITGVTFASNGKIKNVYLPATIRSLIMRNLLDLTNLNVESYGNLETLTIDIIVDSDGITHDVVGSYAIVNAASGTIQTLRLTGIDWILTDTSLLNTMLAMYSTTITGKVYVSGQIRDRELAKFNAEWPDLEVSYDAGNLITSYAIRFVNADGTPLKNKLTGEDYVQYVDRGSDGYDPIVAGEMDIPVQASTEAEDFTYDSWDKSFTTVSGDMTVVAVYTSTPREYTVKWFPYVGAKELASVTVKYNEEAVYPNDLPTRTDMEDSLIYYLFDDWDKSTGCVHGDMNVYANWIRGEYPAVGTLLKDMNEAQIYGLCRLRETAKDINAIGKFVKTKDNISIQMGYLPEFSNVDSHVLATHLYLDGATAIKTGVKPMLKDQGWTIAIDMRNVSTGVGNVFLSCYDTYTQDGMEVYYNDGVQVKNGSNKTVTRAATNGVREMIVIRHKPGDLKYVVYSSNCEAAKIISQDVLFTRNECIDAEIILGAEYNKIDGQFYNYGTCWIENAKCYMADLGADVCKKMAGWIYQVHEVEAYGYNGSDDAITRGTYVSTSGIYTSIDFLFRGALDQVHNMNSSNTNVGGWPACAMRTWLNSRVYEAFPNSWKQMMKLVTVKSSAGNKTTEIVSSQDYIRLASLTELSNDTSSPYGSEIENSGRYIPWFTNDPSRNKWLGNHYLRDGYATFSYNGVPTIDVAHSFSDYQEGDLIRNSANSNVGYLEWDGSMHGAFWWWGRSPYAGYSTSFLSVSNYGFAWGNHSASYRIGAVPGFSV